MSATVKPEADVRISSRNVAVLGSESPLRDERERERDGQRERREKVREGEGEREGTFFTRLADSILEQC